VRHHLSTTVRRHWRAQRLGFPSFLQPHCYTVRAMQRETNTREIDMRGPKTRAWTSRPLREIAELTGARLIGDGTREVRGVASIPSASRCDLVFVEDEKHFPAALKSQAGAVIAREFAAAVPCDKPLLISDHPKLAFARAARALQKHAIHDEATPKGRVHPTAVIHSSVVLARGVYVEERAIVSGHAQIGSNTRIGVGSAIGDGVTIGHDCEIFPNVTIYAGTTLGDRVIVHAGAVLGSDGFGYVRDPKTGHYEKFPQLGTLVIEDDVEIGANATIDRGALDETRIRRGTKIDNLVHIGHNCQIGEGVVIAAQTGISGSVTIENGVVCGGQVGIADHVRIGEGAVLGAQCGVPTNKILRGKGVVFWGTPARPLREYLKQLATLARTTKKEEKKD
jgi:UDP-3-O-[3-hydroxymyristoyl] glucosamine N-acyltransferase